MPPYSRSQAITFAGSLTDGTHWEKHSFTVLAGDGGPVPSGGWAKWAVVDRPQRVGVTVFQGYDPITLTVPVRFDAVAYPAIDGQSIEDDIDRLEWMAGRGKLYFNTPFSPGLGENPLVQISAADAHGIPVPLVPLVWQGAGATWLVTDIAYGDAIRDESGQRIRQDVTVTLLQHIAGPFDSGNDSPATRAKGRAGQKGKFSTVTVRVGLRTYQEIATRFAHNPGAAKQIMDANKTSKKLKSIRSVTAQLPNGAKVKVPLSVRQ